ncbi:hypothetical protein EWM64_g10767 [Hericium alpestre]|uniref:Oxidized purine nucleoside triphosphate hydrolase n=1 Tax=Hericium alpestre TaxID=135208 RepID=A0A4Y9ZEP7_9AGAM|nr:hypothetical protein EWM64_g10767 [Hericium alpestre]
MSSTILPPGLQGDLQEVISGGSTDWLDYQFVKFYTNAYIFQDDKLLLGYKKRGFGVGKYNGFGGKVDPGETPDQAAVRELKASVSNRYINKRLKRTQEEAGIDAPLQHCGTFLFVMKPGPEWAFQIELYRADTYSGTLEETDEMRPQWFSVSPPSLDSAVAEVASKAEELSEAPALSSIPFASMWEGDYLWFPFLLSNQHFTGRVDFEEVDGVPRLARWWFGVPPRNPTD